MTTQQPSIGSPDERSSLDLRFILGLALLALGAALFSLGLLHGFEHGSCSTTGYTAHYGPVQHCGTGIGWWMLTLAGGIAVAGGGAALSGTANTVMVPIMFIAPARRSWPSGCTPAPPASCSEPRPTRVGSRSASSARASRSHVARIQRCETRYMPYQWASTR